MIRGPSRFRRVRTRTESGLPYTAWTRDLPPIPAHFLDSVVFLYEDRPTAERGEEFIGSGFLASVPLSGEHPGARYIVTNQHVACRSNVARLTTYYGATDVVDTPQGRWHQHPDGDDVSVLPLGMAPEVAGKFPAIGWSTFVRGESVVPGDDVFFLGRFVTPEGRQLEAPTARFGHVAMGGTAKLRTPRQIDQESFVVEALSLAGYSGSPVVAFRLQLETPFGGGVRLSVGEPSDRPLSVQQGTPGTPALLGIDWGHINEKVGVRKGPGRGEPVPEATWVWQNRGMAGVVPAWKITELLKSEELEEMRQAQREEINRESSGTTLDSTEEPSQFERFEDLARKLVNVPKKEVDEKRKDES